MMATLVIFIPDAAHPSQTYADNLTLIPDPYFPEVTLELVKRAEALAMFVVFAKVDNPV
ncbi:hypothetical protein L579_1915 [Pantoea sp. AS-PWVM4]|nr:hypothetical protein L579_1915 [Pantoea sp. AS-PWVM4]